MSYILSNLTSTILVVELSCLTDCNHFDNSICKYFYKCSLSLKIYFDLILR